MCVILYIPLGQNYISGKLRQRSSDVLQTYSRRNGLGPNRLDVLQTYYRGTTDVKNTSQLRRHSKRNGKRTINVTFQLIHKDISLNYVPTLSGRSSNGVSTTCRRSWDVFFYVRSASVVRL
eukprot:sb/3476054/